MAVARTGSPTGAHRTGSHSSAFSVTIPADADCVVLDLMATHFTTCQGATGVTCDGVAMTLVSGTDAGSMAFGAPCRHQSWVIIAPNTGTVNITPTFGGTGGVSRSHLAIQFYTGVDQTTPTEGGYASGRITSPTGGTKTFAPTTTTVADDYLICGYHNYGSGVGDIDADGVDIYESYDSNNGTIFGTADKLLTGSGQNMGWTDLTFYDYAGHVFVLKAAGGATDYPLDASSGGYSVTGSNTGFDTSTNANTGTYALTGLAANFDIGINSANGSYSVTGAEASLLTDYAINSETGGYTLTGVATGFDIAINSNTGSYNVTGIDAVIVGDLLINAEIGTHTVTGFDVNLLTNYALNAETGTYIINGFEVNFDALGNYELNAELGSYSVTGTSANFDTSTNAQSGAYSLTGFDVSLLADYAINAETGSIVYTGANTGFDIGISADIGVYSFTGFDCSLIGDYVFNAELGIYAITGFSAKLALNSQDFRQYPLAWLTQARPITDIQQYPLAGQVQSRPLED